MKARIGFVSNSSSSSFIFKLKAADKEPCQCCGRGFGGSEEAIKSLDGMMFQDYEDRETETLQDYVDQDIADSNYEEGETPWIVEYLEKRGITDYTGLYHVSISYHNEGRRFFLEKGGDFEVVDSFS